MCVYSFFTHITHLGKNIYGRNRGDEITLISQSADQIFAPARINSSRFQLNRIIICFQ